MRFFFYSCIIHVIGALSSNVIPMLSWNIRAMDNTNTFTKRSLYFWTICNQIFRQTQFFGTSAGLLVTQQLKNQHAKKIQHTNSKLIIKRLILKRAAKIRRRKKNTTVIPSRLSSQTATTKMEKIHTKVKPSNTNSKYIIE